MKRLETVPFAIKPVTLVFLLSLFKDHEHLPETRQELYERGCTMLCEERNTNRIDQGETGHLTALERMAVAARIAAVSIFCRKPIIAMGSMTAQLSDDEVPVSALVGGDDAVGPHRVAVRDEDVREALGTGLFSSRGSQRMGFAHQTYAEFLASRYLGVDGIDTKKVLALLQHPSDASGRIVPQLYETAGWVASRDKEVLAAIAECDPQVLLRGDTGSLSEQGRQLIADALLRALDEFRANDYDWGLRRQYGKLGHRGLAEQLRPWLTDAERQPVARRAAIEIAKACELKELQVTLADIALDQTEILPVRDSAARVVAAIGDTDTRRRLLPLAVGQAADDTRDQLKGHALRALWPGIISVGELFDCLTTPRQTNFGGAYSGFLETELIENLKSEHIPPALNWLKALASNDGVGHWHHSLADKIILRAWECIGEAPVLEALAETALERFRHYHGLIYDDATVKDHAELFDNPTNRRALAARIVGLSQDQRIPFDLTTCSPGLIRLEDLSDFEWCVERLLASIGNSTEPVWAALAWSMFYRGEPCSVRLACVTEARGVSPCLKRESDAFFGSVEISSERAAEMREQYLAMQDRGTKRPIQVLKWAPKDRIEHWLSRCEAGELQVWLQLLLALTLEDTDTKYGTVRLDIRRLPGWGAAAPATRLRIVKAADSVVRFAPVDPLKWQREPHRWGNDDIAAYAALFILKQESPVAYDALPGWVWQRHVATVVCTPFYDEDNGQRQEHEEIALKCYECSPAAMLYYVPMQLDAENRDGRHISCDKTLGQCWDDKLKQVVHETLVRGQEYWRAESFDHIAALLLQHGHQPTRDMLATLVRSVSEGVCVSQERAQLAAAELITDSPDAAWPVIWPAILADRELGRGLLMNIAHGLHHNAGQVTSKLTETQLADLYVWLVKEFPYSQDPDHGGTYFGGPEGSVREFRDAVVRFLEDKGTPDSVDALQKASDALPDQGGLKSIVVEARKNCLRRTWIPCAPAELLAAVAQPGSKLVRNASELQDLLVEVLVDLENKLQGETPAAPDLWDQTSRVRGSEKWRPKDENHLSDWVKRNLETALVSRGVIAAREPVIRRGEGSGTGEATDIHVTAVVPGLDGDAYEQAEVIIEVKGCWHRKLKTAMKTQLVDRYLKDNECQHGIYVVGWYLCDQWDGGDYQKRNTPKWTPPEARSFFEEQAERLSVADIRIRAVVLNTALR